MSGWWEALAIVILVLWVGAALVDALQNHNNNHNG